MVAWKVLAESVAGTSHQRTSLPCQDANHHMQIRIEDETVLIAICADGAGSAELSQIGSKVACQRFFDLAYEALTERGTLEFLDREILLGWYEDVREAISLEALARGVPARQLACTLLTAIVGEARAWFAQVGDGSIVFRSGEAYESAFWPQVGDYANTTNFVTQSELDDVFECSEQVARIEELALFTDGLQRLALDFSARRVHRQFFAPMFSSLRSAEEADSLVVPLRSFLDSPQVNERTDDDKTLILATRLTPDAPLAG
jgi:Protein phosphatase 2C